MTTTTAACAPPPAPARCGAPTAATVLIDDQALGAFLTVAVGAYRRLTAETPLPCFALLLGQAEAATFHVRRVVFGRNARTSDPAARQEFSETIVPRFGPAYENEHRGWWMDSADLLKAARQAEEAGLDLLGSIHMHPDWHRIGPPSARAHVLSERPTPMDHHLFEQAGWPLNLICYLERRAGAFFHSLAAWTPSPPGAPEGAGCTGLDLRVRTSTRPGT
ncbi:MULTISPECIES: hypothetical protein [unclassified Streptomyces]|uniref:hypothetical protein n=1 Tax=unclassified Streptomyces TaxID=2593676 RepID=UPI0009A1213F|nr:MULTISPECIES: hypothetical protein [unclassified Streptomyces]